jgi:hypothetical protein
MRVFMEIDSETQFKVGDIIAKKNEIVSSHDGNRGTFNDYKRLVLRPVENDVKATLKLISDRLCKFSDDYILD